MSIIKVEKKKANFRTESARELYYNELVKFNGKPVADFITAMTETPAKLPKSGRAEKAKGWLNWFVREKYATLVDSKK
jgi:hypothetical protein